MAAGFHSSTPYSASRLPRVGSTGAKAQASAAQPAAQKACPPTRNGMCSRCSAASHSAKKLCLERVSQPYSPSQSPCVMDTAIS